MQKKIKVEGKDVEAAIMDGLKELGLRRDQAEVTVISHPAKGFLGLGAKPAVVEIRQKHWQGRDLDSQIYMDVPKRKEFKKGGRSEGRDGHGGRRNGRGSSKDAKYARKEYGNVRKFNGRENVSSEAKPPKENETQLLPSQEIQSAVTPENIQGPMNEAKETLASLLGHIGIKIENLNSWWDGKQQRILLTFDCDHPAIIIGKEGRTFEAIQYLLTLSVSRHFATPISVVVDTQNYSKKSEDKLICEIDRAVKAIERGSEVYRLKPMPAALRRFVHRALMDNPLVETASEGEGKWRKVVIKKRTAPAAETAAQPADAQDEVQAVSDSGSEIQEQPVSVIPPAAETAPVENQQNPQSDNQ